MSMIMDGIGPSKFGRGDGDGAVACAAVYEPVPAIGRDKEGEDSCSSSATSSIGRNSDMSEGSTTAGGGDGADADDDNEVQSAYNGVLDMMNSLEEVLPIRRGISSFYNGKSKSFTSLAEASSTSSIKDIAKQENAYTRRRRNLLAINHVWDKSRGSLHRSGSGYGISKRPLSSSRSTLALAVAMSSSESLSSGSDDSNSNSRSPPSLPPLRPSLRRGSKPYPWRSYSVADLQHCRTEATATAVANACSSGIDRQL